MMGGGECDPSPGVVTAKYVAISVRATYPGSRATRYGA